MPPTPGISATDLGTRGTESVDYPDYAESVALAVLEGRADRGVVVCGSGVGASVAANKLPGIRAGLCHDTYSAHQGVEHDDVNVLVVGARVIGRALAFEIFDAFAQAFFSKEARHMPVGLRRSTSSKPSFPRAANELEQEGDAYILVAEL